MKISTKGRYGLEALLDMAIHISEGHTSLKSISERQGMSENYLEQLFVSLRKNGIVESIRGAQGGYRFAKPTDEITVGEILRALEGPLSPVKCVVNRSCCDRFDFCATRTLWGKLMNNLDELVDGITITDLIQDYRNMNSEDFEIEYYI